MKLKEGVNGIIINEPDCKIAIADDGYMKELWFSGTMKKLSQALGKTNLEQDDSNFAEKLVEDLK